jgi:N-acetylglucosamine kinase-like BadF-type ATPase
VTRQACKQLNATPAAVVSVFLGIAGVTEPLERGRMERLAKISGLTKARVRVDHDIRIALAGGLAGRPGIALIVGTGSSCYGRNAAGRTWQAGGWESLVSDEGSGYYIGREAIVAAVRMADGRMQATALMKRVFHSLGIARVAQILRRLHDPPVSKKTIASLAPMVIELAESGDSRARHILNQGATLLAEMVTANQRHLFSGSQPEVVVTGGLGTADRLYRRLIYAAIRRELPKVKVGPPQLQPAVGAVILAMQQVGLQVTEKVLENMKAHPR